jgi:hypothetical protein
MRSMCATVLMIGGIFAVTPLCSDASESSAPGVNPKDNITKMEILFRYENFDNGAFMYVLPVKFDFAFNENWGGNLELPFLSFNGRDSDADGIGDFALRGRYLHPLGKITLIAGGEMIVPTASSDALGAGQWQVNPSGGLVYQFTGAFFMYAGYKHIFSVHGDGDRPDLNLSQPRFLVAKVTPKGQWFLADAKYTKSWKERKNQVLDLEGEVGTMIGPSTGIFVRTGTSYLDGNKEFVVLVGLRKIW